MVSTQEGWAQQSKGIWEMSGRRLLGWASGRILRPAKGTLCGYGWCVVGGQGLGWARLWVGRGSLPGSGGGWRGRRLLNPEEWDDSRGKPFSAPANQMPLPSCSPPNTLFLQSREKNRQSSLERVGLWQDVGPVLSPPKESQPPAYGSISSDTCLQRWVGRPAVCFHSSFSSPVIARTDLYCNYIHKYLNSPVDCKFREAGIHSKT